MSTHAGLDAPGAARTARWELIVIGGAVVLGLALRVLAFSRPLGEIDGAFVPDDTYYTLAIARSLAHGHGPAAGAGIASSGFQPLLAFLLVPVYRLTDDLDLAFRADLLLLILADLVSIVLMFRLGRRIAGPVAGGFAALAWACSPLALRNAMGGLEASLAVTFALAFLLAWLWTGDAGAPTGRFVLLGVTGGLLVLARTDAALLVLLVLVVELLIGRVRRLVPVLVGAGAVALPWFAYCTVRFGSPLPSSGGSESRLAPLPRLGSRIAALTTNAFVGGPFTVGSSFRSWFSDHTTVGAVLFWGSLVALTVFGVVALARRGARPAPTPGDVLAVFALFSAGLIGFYGWFGVYWYDIRYLLPVAAGVTLFVVAAGARLWEWTPARFLVVPVGIGLLVVAIAGSVTEATRTGQEVAFHAFATGFASSRRPVVATLPQGARVGAYQSGALSYFGADRIEVVNLDGVVNPDAPSPHRPQATARYVADQGVRWIADNSLFVAAVVVNIRQHRALGLRTRSVRTTDDVVVAHLVPADR